MAINFNITAGSGTIIGADEVTWQTIAAKFQVVKVMLGTDGAFQRLLQAGETVKANSIPVCLPTDQTPTFAATPVTSGGTSISRVISAASTNATSAKGSAGQVYGWSLSNTNAAARYFKLYNKASAPTVGTDTPVITILLPPSWSDSIHFDTGIAFGTGIAFALTTGIADSDTGAVAANEHIVNLYYK